MPLNKNALIRYRTIDRCLVNRQRKWTLEAIIEACSDALYEYEGRRGISKRTIQLDIQTMRSGKFGYEAPIIVRDKKYYSYASADFSITNIPISAGELDKLNEVVMLLKQFAGFNHFGEIDAMVKKLEDKIDVARSDRQPIIHIEQNRQLKGLEYLDDLYKYILNKEVLAIKYKAFHRLEKSNIRMHPYYLKEYNQRWYLIGFSEYRRNIISLALDRIHGIESEGKQGYIKNNFFKPDQYFSGVIGMTVDLAASPIEIFLYIDSIMAPYVLTKPLHHSQELLWEAAGAIIIAISVRINFELKEKIRSLGKHTMVLKPTRLKNWFEKDLGETMRLYEDKALRSRLWKALRKK